MRQFSRVARAADRLGRTKPSAITRAMALLALLTGFTAMPAHALVMLDYTGNNFTTIPAPQGPTPPPDPYTAADFVSGSITLPMQLAANLVSAIINPISFSFTDGVNTIDSASATSTGFFVFSTDTGAQVTDWSVGVEDTNIQASGGFQRFIQTINFPTTPFAQDIGSDALCNADNPGFCQRIKPPSYIQQGFNQRIPGIWAYQLTGVPEPSTLPIALVGLGAVGLMAWRRRVVPVPNRSLAPAA